jgi:hypothetical protein
MPHRGLTLSFFGLSIHPIKAGLTYQQIQQNGLQFGVDVEDKTSSGFR